MLMDDDEEDEEVNVDQDDQIISSNGSGGIVIRPSAISIIQQQQPTGGSSSEPGTGPASMYRPYFPWWTQMSSNLRVCAVMFAPMIYIRGEIRELVEDIRSSVMCNTAVKLARSENLLCQEVVLPSSHNNNKNNKKKTSRCKSSTQNVRMAWWRTIARPLACVCVMLIGRIFVQRTLSYWSLFLFVSLFFQSSPICNQMNKILDLFSFSLWSCCCCCLAYY